MWLRGVGCLYCNLLCSSLVSSIVPFFGQPQSHDWCDRASQSGSHCDVPASGKGAQPVIWVIMIVYHCLCTHMSVFIYVCISVCMCVSVCMLVCVYMCLCVSVAVCTCVCVCMLYYYTLYNIQLFSLVLGEFSAYLITHSYVSNTSLFKRALSFQL